MHEQRADLGSRLGMFRQRTKLYQKDIASLVGVTAITIKNWENGHFNPSAKNLKKLIEVYLQYKAFSTGHEQEEIEDLWAMAVLNVEFDREWFIGISATQVSSVKEPPESSLIVDEQETGESDMQSTRVHAAISEADEFSRNRDGITVTGDNPSSRFDAVWESFMLYMGDLTLKNQNRSRMLDQIHSMWIKGLLEKSLQNTIPIKLELHEQPDAVISPWYQSLQGLSQPKAEHPCGLHILDACQEPHG